ncbi:ATP-binding cassette domain-containing protein [Candidatus Margulisiibacteriota bacterium]
MGDLIEIKGLCKHFGSVKALDNVSLTVSKGEILGVAGESGSGKTTLGRLILKLIPPTSGGIHYKKKDISLMTDPEEKAYRREVQIIFQNPYTSLNPRMRIGEALEEPLRIHGKLERKERLKKVLKLLDTVELSKKFYDKYPHELSGGERQRVGVARALSLDPKMIVLDEPVSSLDVSIQAQILNLLKDIRTKYNLTYIFISHDLSVVRYLCDRVAVLQNGKIVEVGDSKKLFSRPGSSYTKKLIASVPKLLK